MSITEGIHSKMFKRMLKSIIQGIRYRPLTEREDISFSYYERLHKNSRAYATNNWLLDQHKLISFIEDKIVFELGCGNGAFSRIAAKRAKMVFAADWALSNQFPARLENLAFLLCDATKISFPKSDISCSGDVLEHFEEKIVIGVVSKLVESAEFGYHVIACYDDGHSHLCVKPPEWWEQLFKSYDSSYKLHEVTDRKGQISVTITNIFT